MEFLMKQPQSNEKDIELPKETGMTENSKTQR